MFCPRLYKIKKWHLPRFFLETILTPFLGFLPRQKVFYIHPYAVLLVNEPIVYKFRPSHVYESLEHLLWPLVTDKQWCLLNKPQPSLLRKNDTWNNAMIYPKTYSLCCWGNKTCVEIRIQFSLPCCHTKHNVPYNELVKRTKQNMFC